MIERDAKDVPDIVWEYWGWYETSLQYPGLYSIDNHRSSCHIRLCEYYKLSREKTREITDHMQDFQTACELHDSLLELKNNAE